MKLLVILGAGASSDCWNGSSNRTSSLRPPLANELFSERANTDFAEVFEKYPGARVLASALAPYTEPGSLDLEKRLQDFAISDDPNVRQHYKHVRPYLRDLLNWVGNSYVGRYPGTHMHLVLRAIADSAHDVTFLSLNYDLIIEDALSNYDSSLQINSLDSYIRLGRNIAVIKPHGSVNWATSLADYDYITGGTDEARWFRVVRELEVVSGPVETIFITRRVKHIAGYTYEDPEGTKKFAYPVLTAPLADKNVSRFVCPSSHIEYLEEFTEQVDKILIIGTSGLDDDVMEVLARSNEAADQITYISDGNAEQCRINFEKAVPGFKIPNHKVHIWNNGFKDYLVSSECDAFLGSESR